jgi:tetratricopeptide (TPR) repeat protein
MSEPLQLAVSRLNAGRLDEAERICHEVLETRAADPWALIVLACAANARENYSAALSLVARAMASGSDLPHLYVEQAIAHAGLGASAAALQAARRAVTMFPNVPKGYEVLSRILYPGEDYYAVLRRMHDCLQPRSYLEIGVDNGGSIRLAQRPTIAVGIDPAPNLHHAPGSGCKIFQCSSDAYFETRNLRSDMESDEVDFAFIDGLHIFEQALRDFINIERFAGPQTVVAIHDCLPIDPLTAARERHTVFWSGDVWKLPLCLREYRADLKIYLVPTPPTGLCLVRNLDRHSKILTDN